MISMYILCKLNDTDYAYPIFSQFDNYEKAFDEALISCGYFLDQDMQIDIVENRKRISAQAEDNFFVTEIIEFDENKGSHILIWHHAYNEVGFDILYIGTQDECLQRKRQEIRKILDDISDGNNEDLDVENCNVIDTGEEWEVFSVVEIERI